MKNVVGIISGGASKSEYNNTHHSLFLSMFFIHHDDVCVVIPLYKKAPLIIIWRMCGGQMDAAGYHTNAPPPPTHHVRTTCHFLQYVVVGEYLYVVIVRSSTYFLPFFSKNDSIQSPHSSNSSLSLAIFCLSFQLPYIYYSYFGRSKYNINVYSLSVAPPTFFHTLRPPRPLAVGSYTSPQYIYI